MKQHPTAIVDSKADLADDVEIGPFSIVEAGARLGPGTVIGSHVVIHGSVSAGNGNRFHQACAIGDFPQDVSTRPDHTKVVIGDNNVFREFVTIHRGTDKSTGLTTVGNDCYIMAYAHVAHDCAIGNNVILTNTATLGGHVDVEDHSYLSAFVAVHQHCRVGTYSFSGAATAVTKDVVPYALVVSDTGNRPKVFGPNVVGLKRAGFNAEQLRNIRSAFRILFRSKLNTTQALEVLRDEFGGDETVGRIITFIEASKRGIVK